MVRSGNPAVEVAGCPENLRVSGSRSRGPSDARQGWRFSSALADKNCSPENVAQELN